jgi:hypothetical protein
MIESTRGRWVRDRTDTDAGARLRTRHRRGRRREREDAPRAMPRRRRGVEARGATPPDARGSERARRIRRRVSPPRFRAPRLREAFIDRASDARGSGRETTTYRLLESSRRRDLGGERRGVHGVERAVGCAGRAPRARSRDASSRAVSHRNASQGTARVSDWRRMGTGISADFRGDGESRLSQQWRRRRIAYYGENYSRSAVSTAVVWRSIGDVGAFTPGC